MCLAVEKTQDVDVDYEDDGVGRERAHAGDRHAAEEHGDALGTPAAHDAVDDSRVAASQLSGPRRRQVHGTVRLQPAFNDVDRHRRRPGRQSGHAARDQVGGQRRLGATRWGEAASDTSERQHVDGKRRRLTHHGDVRSMEQHPTAANRVQVSNTVERTTKSRRSCVTRIHR